MVCLYCKVAPVMEGSRDMCQACFNLRGRYNYLHDRFKKAKTPDTKGPIFKDIAAIDEYYDGQYKKDCKVPLKYLKKKGLA